MKPCNLLLTALPPIWPNTASNAVTETRTGKRRVLTLRFFSSKAGIMPLRLASGQQLCYKEMVATRNRRY